MLAYCEVCRVVVHNPSAPHKGGDYDMLKDLRSLTGTQFFGHCPICRRVQVFELVTEIKET